MSKTISQKVTFKNTKPKALYEMYMDSKKHSKATAAPAKISKKEGGEYSAAGGYIKGKNIKLVKDQFIMQTWRGVDWLEEDADSIFIINLEKKGKDVVLHAVHANVPDKFADSVDKGWHTHYWTPWKSYLKGKPISAPPTM
jgi:activator of HSP90 ATPase